MESGGEGWGGTGVERVNRGCGEGMGLAILWEFAVLQAKLDAILGAECVLCGDLMVETIDKEFEAMDTTKDDSWN